MPRVLCEERIYAAAHASAACRMFHAALREVFRVRANIIRRAARLRSTIGGAL